MKHYKVFKHPTGSYEAVKQGWSWPAFFFGAFWALAKKLWILGGGIIIAAIIYSFVVSNLVTTANAFMIAMIIQYLIAGAIWIFLGLKGNALREEDLVSRDLQYIATVSAKNSVAAIMLCIESEVRI